MLYPAAKLTTTDLGYAVTGHTGQGGTMTRGEAVFRGGEPREWAYVALTRGRERNTARVITQARAAADPETAQRHTRTAASAEALQPAYRRIEARLEEVMGDRRAWEQVTAGPRRLAVAADSELRRRYPDKQIEPLCSAEPRALEDDEITKPQPEAGPAETPEWATQLAEQRRAFQEMLAERQNVMVPDEDPDYGFLGQAWPWQERDPDAILQPPRPELRPCAGVERLTGYEMPDREAGS